MTGAPSGAGTYSCYGLTVASSLELPELVAAGPETASGRPDVRIVSEELPDDAGEGRPVGRFARVEGDRVWVHVPGVARYLVTGGSSIVVAPEPGGDAESVRAFLLSAGFAAILYQRGLLVLHGNAVAVGDACLVCVGPSRSGKSTLAAALMRRGHRVLADDVVPVDAACRVLPGLARIKLWQDSAEQLDIETAGLRRVRPALGKFNLPVGDRYPDGPLPVRWVYVLAAHPAARARLEPVTGMQRYQALRANTYGAGYLEGMELAPDHLRLCGVLASRVRMARLTRPVHGFDVDALVERVLDDVAAHS